MNDILGKIGWGAVAVDGFIPPAAFMEFQAYKVLVIACDMRQLHHIEYTPAPDIVHEAAGHAPIIVDREYSDYLQRFGEVGRQGDVVEERFRALRSDPASLDPEGIAEFRSEGSRRSDAEGGRTARRISATPRRWRCSRGCIGGRSNTA